MAALVVGTTLLAAPAQASPGDAVAEGDAGAVTMGSTVLGPVAPCTTAGTLVSTAAEVSVPDVVSVANAGSRCAVDDSGEFATVTVTGERFRLDVLRQYGGPRIRVARYTATCATTLTGTTASVEFAGLSGVATPSRIPPNHVVTIPGDAAGRPLATVTFNETVYPTRPDGSMTVHLMHVRVFPAGGPWHGDVRVGTVRCSPVS